MIPWQALALTSLLLVFETGSLWIARRLLHPTEREDGAPRASLLNMAALADVAATLLLLLIARQAHWQLFDRVRLWRHDPASAVLIGAMAGLFLNLAGSGSPVSIAVLVSHSGRHGDRRPDGPTVLLIALGETAVTIAWFGIALGVALMALPRLPAFALVAAGFGLRRAATGQDHPLLGALDGLLLVVLAVLSGSLIAVFVARGVSEAFAYARMAEDLEEADALAEHDRPAKAG